MVNKKLILGFFIISFLGACATPTAMLGPAYTLTSSGNGKAVVQVFEGTTGLSVSGTNAKFVGKVMEMPEIGRAHV